MRTNLATLGTGVLLAILLTQAADARQPPADDALAVAVANAQRTIQISDTPATLVFANRRIVELRAIVLARPPAKRAEGAALLLDRFTSDDPAARVTAQVYGDAVAIRVGARPVLVLFQADVDPLAGESLDAKAAATVAQLQIAFDEAVELRSAGRLARAAALAAAATLAYALVMWLLIRVDRRIAARLASSAEQRLRRLPGGDAIAHVANTPTNVRRAFAAFSFLSGALLTFVWLAFVLRRFPYTRPWGESLRSALVAMIAAAARGLLDALPSLVTILVIVLFTRIMARLAGVAFGAVEQGRIAVPGVHPDTAQPTRRLVVALLWLLALVVCYPYMPGSQSDVFKGVSVFVGLIVSLGSSGVMMQAMSGLMVTYSRALRAGDFVRVAGVEGTVTAVGTLATKVRTPRNEEITIPNAIIVSNTTTNLSRNGDVGVFVPTAVTIGYDVPWRQVRSLLLLAAERTPGVRKEPQPTILQTGLKDFYVEYTLLVALEQPHRRGLVLDALHASIQDAFNEFGVQIMSPNYEADPDTPKIVPPSRWHAAPAVSDGLPGAPVAGAVAPRVQAV